MSDFGVTTALQYSGGRDSRCLLHLYKDQLDKIIVVWMNPGDPYPEQLAEMHRLAATIPHFLILHGNVVKNIQQHGLPSDIVPINNTAFGLACVKSDSEVKIQSSFDCCSKSMWEPLQQAMRMLGITKVIRGQRAEETYINSAISNGSVVDGVTYELPMQGWTLGDVEDYLRNNHIKIPDYYKTEGTSHDCMHCTGYLASYEKRINNLPADSREVVIKRLSKIRYAVEKSYKPLQSLTTGTLVYR